MHRQPLTVGLELSAGPVTHDGTSMLDCQYDDSTLLSWTLERMPVWGCASLRPTTRIAAPVTLLSRAFSVRKQTPG
jgi:hypothetical protein